jgi:hypothetical protein
MGAPETTNPRVLIIGLSGYCLFSRMRNMGVWSLSRASDRPEGQVAFHKLVYHYYS